MSRTRTKIALFPFDAKEGDRVGNLARVTEAAVEAASAGARILVLPEMWSCGYDLGAARAEGEVPGTSWQREIDAVCALSEEHGIAIVGSVMEPAAEPGGTPWNAAIAHDAGREVARYRKAHLFAPLAEDQFIAAGDALPEPFDLGDVRTAMAVCYDLRFPELFRPASSAGVDLWCIAAQWPTVRIAQWRALLVARAIENQCFVAGVNRCGRLSRGGGDSDTPFGGNAMLVGPTGEVILDSGDRPELLVGEFDPAEARSWRERFPAFGDRRTDLY